MLLVELDDQGHRLRFEVRGGAAGGIQSSMFVSCSQLKLPSATPGAQPASVADAATAPLPVQSKYALLLDAGGLAVPAEAIDEPGAPLELKSSACASASCFCADIFFRGGRRAERAHLTHARRPLFWNRRRHSCEGPLRKPHPRARTGPGRH